METKLIRIGLVVVVASAGCALPAGEVTDPGAGGPGVGGAGGPGTGGAGGPRTGGTGGGTGALPCTADEALPPAFSARCAGCHGATGEGGGRGTNLYSFAGSLSDFVAVVRSGAGEMPSFDEAEFSRPDLEAIYGHFQSGNPPGCTPTNACGETLPAPAPLFAGGEVPAIAFTRDDGTLVLRGAGRVRGRHELEGSFSEFGGRYFENRSYAFEIEDSVAMGGNAIRFTYMPEAEPSTYGPATNFRYFKVYGNGNLFHRNTSLEPAGDGRYEQGVEGNAREGRPLAVGDVLEFEFGIFIAGQDPGDPGAIEGRTSYYTDTFRYVVGEGRLSARNDDGSGTIGPDESAVLGGATTIPFIYAEPELYFSQMALNMQPEHVEDWLEGRRVFHTDFETGEHSEAGNPAFGELAGLLGPEFNAHRCSECHVRNGRSAPPAVGEPLRHLAVKLYGDSALGSQLQPTEALVRIARYEAVPVSFADGTTAELQRPLFEMPQPGMNTSVRVARRLVGMGLLEAISERDVLLRADPTDCDGDGISGRPQLVVDPRDGTERLGRFGWRAEKASVEHQVADALEADFGVTSSYFPEVSGHAELNDELLAQLTTYVRLLGVPPQRDSDAPEVRQGAQLFAELGCASCHAPSARTADTHDFAELRGQAIAPYTDLLLHDMGEGLADDSGTDEAREWRTPPLWGIGLVEEVSGHQRFLHDGRARSLLEAVLWHGGEAEEVQQRVLQLGAEERAALVAFLESL